MLVIQCTKKEITTYNAHFFAATASTENLILFIDDQEEGQLFKTQGDISCSSEASILDQLITLQLSYGNYKIEVKDENDDVKAVGNLGISSNGLSIIGEGGGMAAEAEDDCLFIKISF
ncbi:hypothetical protein [Portibacter lacus]|uniref:Uncharacterized protein n=1 Tax=Portibacter lacus TaxID=1099794 RepID=A0AA37SV23_9BACT|nr:hypothetical protein [Portibacter lacus]GLR20149.1 hypothetical protein GCM10007940_47650 [Portibacter lacus]